jgi:hypothetical protein
MLDPGSIPTSISIPKPTSDIPHSAFSAQSSKPSNLTEDYGDSNDESRTLGGGVDFFSSLGTEHKRKDPNEGKPDPSKLVIDGRELNRQLVEGKSLDDYETPKESKKIVPGGPGSSWRMMKLRRLYEQAEEQYVYPPATLIADDCF